MGTQIGHGIHVLLSMGLREYLCVEQEEDKIQGDIKMKTGKAKEFREEVEGWLNFNKNRQPIDLLDLSKLMAIFRRYFILKLKKSSK